MVTKKPAFKDDASAAEVSRWMEMQASVSRSTSRHSKVLESVLNPGSVPAPDSTPVNPLLPRWSRALPPQPLKVTRNPEYDNPIDDPETDAALAKVRAAEAAEADVPVGAALTKAPGDDDETSKSREVTHANRVATQFMGVDPATGKQNRVSYDGMGGIKTHYMEIYNSVGDPKNAQVMNPLVKIARQPQSKIALGNQYTESLRGTEETRARWSEKAYVTSKQRMDAPVAAAVGEIPGVAEEKAEARRLFMNNVVSTRLYYGDLFNEEGQAAIEAKLADPTVSADEKEEILAALREVHAGVQPLRDRTVSGSVQTHRAGFRPSEAHTKRTKEIAQSIERITGGKQSERAVEAREQRKREARRVASEERARLDAYKLEQAAEARRRRDNPVGVDCDPSRKDSSHVPGRSQVTIGMPNVKSVVPNVSEYVRVTNEVAHGYGKYPGAKRDPPVFCPPFGNNWLGETRADRPAYPTPGYLTRPFARATAPNVNRRAREGDPITDLNSTTQRSSYQARDPIEAAAESRKAREMLAGNKLKRSESFIPLGSKGLMDHPRHQRETKYSKDFAAEPRYAQVRGGE